MIKGWVEDLVSIGATDDHSAAFHQLAFLARKLGFDFFAIGITLPLGKRSGEAFLENNYPEVWRSAYESNEFIALDPVVQACSSQETTLRWGTGFGDAADFWEEAASHGIGAGVSKSNFDWAGGASLVTMSRSHDLVSDSEMSELAPKLKWLSVTVHSIYSKILHSQSSKRVDFELTPREVEVLNWTAEGKTAWEISIILGISCNTVNFHLKNVTAKMGTQNKTSAAVKAALMGLI